LNPSESIADRERAPGVHPDQDSLLIVPFADLQSWMSD
jgi:hypothetical protein